jgi:hypothetical protein
MPEDVENRALPECLIHDEYVFTKMNKYVCILRTLRLMSRKKQRVCYFCEAWRAREIESACSSDLVDYFAIALRGTQRGSDSIEPTNAGDADEPKAHSAG